MKVGFKETTYEKWAVLYYSSAQDEANKREKEISPCLFCKKEQQMYKMVWVTYLTNGGFWWFYGGFWWFCDDNCRNLWLLTDNLWGNY